MTVLWTVRATEPTAVFSPQRKYKTVGSSPASATNNAHDLDIGAGKPETKRFLGFFFLFFKVKFYRYPPSKTSFGEELN